MKNVIFYTSIVLNIVLIIIVFFVYSRLDSNKEIASNEIQHQLIEVESVIGEQMQLSWRNPELVTRQLDKSLKIMRRSFELIEKSSIAVNKSDIEVIDSVLGKLELYKKAESQVEPQEIDCFEMLSATLRKEGVGQGIPITVNNYDAFIGKMKALDYKIENPLDKK